MSNSGREGACASAGPSARQPELQPREGKWALDLIFPFIFLFFFLFNSVLFSLILIFFFFQFSGEAVSKALLSFDIFKLKPSHVRIHTN